MLRRSILALSLALSFTAPAAAGYTFWSGNRSMGGNISLNGNWISNNGNSVGLRVGNAGVVTTNAPMAANAGGGIQCYDTNAFAIGVGCRLVMGGTFNVAGSFGEFASVAGIKENSTTDDYAGTLAFYTRAVGSGTWGNPVASANSLGQWTFGGASNNLAKFTINDTGATQSYHSVVINKTEAFSTDTEGAQNAAVQINTTGSGTTDGASVPQPVALGINTTQNGNGADAVGIFSVVNQQNNAASVLTRTGYSYFGQCNATTSKSACVNYGGGINNSSGVSRAYTQAGGWYFIGIDMPYAANGTSNKGEVAGLARTIDGVGKWSCGWCVGNGAVADWAYSSPGFSVDAVGGVVLGAATGGSKGVGTMNVQNDIYRNNALYTFPDYVFEKHFTGKIEKFASNPGASTYAGLISIDETEAFAARALRLPGIDDNPKGIFERGDVLLEKIEEAYLHIFELNKTNKRMQACLANWKCRIFGIGG